MNAINNAFDPSDNTVRVKWNITVSAWDVDRIKNATDLVKTFTYLDLWTVDERVSVISYVSASEWNFTETINYDWLSWGFYIINITTS